MLTEKLNILTVNGDDDLQRLIKGVFSSIKYELNSFTGSEFPLNELSQKNYHLVIIDGTRTPFRPDQLRQVQLGFPNVHFIFIDSDYSQIKNWSEFKQLNIVTSDKLPERLPIVLSHFYTEFNNRLISNLYYWRLIKIALEESVVFTAIVDKTGDILFLNKVGQEILKISFDEESRLKFYDFLKEGEKVWQFLTRKWKDENAPLIQMDMQLMDRNFNEFHFPVTIHSVANTQNYYIIQGKTLSEPSHSPAGSDSETLLKAFSDSLANELLNPLNVIWGRLQLFQTNAQLNDRDIHNLNLIEKQIQRINEVISKLVAFTSIKRDLVPQRVFLNEIIRRLPYQPSFQNQLESKTDRLRLQLGKNIPPLFGQTAQFELLLSTILDLLLNLSGSLSRIIIQSSPSEPSDSDKKEIEIRFKIENFTDAADQHLLKTSLHFDETSKKKFALEMTIIRYILDEYKIRHHLQEDASSLILSLTFPIN